MHPKRPVNPVLSLERNAQDAPSAAFIITATQTITNAEALVNVKQIAYELRRLGVKPGDMVALDLPEVLGLMFVEAVFHEAAASTVMVPGYDPKGVFEIDWFVTSSADATAPSGSRLVAIDERFLELVAQNPYGISALEYESDDSLMWVIFSSGTTGKPSAIPASIGQLQEYADTMPELWARRGTFLCFLPAKTPMGLFAFHLSALRGIPFLAIGDNVAAETVTLVDRNRVKTLALSPAQVTAFVGELEAQGRTLPQIDNVFTVGTAMSPELNVRMRAATEGCEIFSVYGSSEAGAAALRNYETDDPFDVGDIASNAEVQIVDDDGAPVADGEVGRIRHRTSYMAHEYLGDPAGTAESFVDGWFYPGDLGLIRPDGGLTLAGRSSEILNAGGVKINPVRLDQFAVTLDGVKDAAAFGYDTAAGIQQIGIALVTVDGIDVQAVIRAFETQFGPASPLLVARVTEIPRNAMGKPLRRDLAEKYREN